MIAWLRNAALLTGAGIAAVAGLLGWNTWTYHRLTSESDVATVELHQVAPQHYLATLSTPDGKSRQFALAGDEWQLDARLLTWRPWATLLGADPVYRLDRLAGRYRDTDQARTAPRTLHDLTDNPGLDIWAFARDGSDWVPGVDAAYGTAVFLPMADGARYRISVSRHGLVARPYNGQATTIVSSWY